MEKESIYTLIMKLDSDCFVTQHNYEEMKKELEIVDDNFDGLYDGNFLTEINNGSGELSDGEMLLLKDGVPIIPKFGINVEF